MGAINYRNPVIRVALFLSICAALVLGVVVLGVLWIVFSMSGPSSVTFMVYNGTGERLSDLALSCEGRVYSVGVIEPGRTGSARLPVRYQIPYRYAARLLEGDPISGEAAQWIDEDAEGRIKSYKIQLVRTGGGIECRPGPFPMPNQ